MIEYYDRDGRPLDRESAWALLVDYDYKRVDLTEVGPYVVSTVWLGLDHRYMGEGPPLIFETMVFTNSAWNADRADENRELLLELDCQRYSTLQQAQEGHRAMVLLVEATLDEEVPTEASEGVLGPQELKSSVLSCMWCLNTL